MHRNQIQKHENYKIYSEKHELLHFLQNYFFKQTKNCSQSLIKQYLDTYHYNIVEARKTISHGYN